MKLSPVVSSRASNLDERFISTSYLTGHEVAENNPSVAESDKRSLHGSFKALVALNFLLRLTMAASSKLPKIWKRMRIEIVSWPLFQFIRVRLASANRALFSCRKPPHPNRGFGYLKVGLDLVSHTKSSLAGLSHKPVAEFRIWVQLRWRIPSHSPI